MTEQSKPSDQSASAPFIHRRQVRWADADVARAVDLTTITRYTMEALEEWYVTRLGVNWTELQLQRHIAAPFVHAEFDFRRPVAAGETVAISVTVEKLGRSSVVFRVIGSTEKDTRCCWEARLTSVFLGADTLQSIPVPERFRTVIDRSVESERG
jgi:4-hydroxybenzoyl-CoA thioesterase